MTQVYGVASGIIEYRQFYVDQVLVMLECKVIAVCYLTLYSDGLKMYWDGSCCFVRGYAPGDEYVNLVS